MWYREKIGNNNCPIVDTWWQTETGGILISPVPGAMATKPGSATKGLPGIDMAWLGTDGEEKADNVGGLLVVRKPWPAMLRTIFGNPERFKNGYYARFEGMYLAGDGARRDEDGYIWIMGRI